MKTTVLKRDGKKIGYLEAELLARNVEEAMMVAGFETTVHVDDDRSLKIGLGGFSCFRIIPSMLGYNAKVGRHVDSPKGYKRTRVPLWDQRVKFNHILNDVLDSEEITCSVRSSGFVIRTIRSGRVNEWYPTAYQGNGDQALNGLGDVHSENMTEKEALEYVMNRSIMMKTGTDSSRPASRPTLTLVKGGVA